MERGEFGSAAGRSAATLGGDFAGGRRCCCGCLRGGGRRGPARVDATLVRGDGQAVRREAA
eukprot:5677948-Prymnesium_polylepis.1